MIARGPALVAVAAAITVGASSASIDADASRCGPPSAAESLVVARERAIYAAASQVRRIAPTTASLRARADTFARYAAYRPDARPDSAALALAYEAQLYLALGMPDTALAPARASVALAISPRGRASAVFAHTTLGEVHHSRGHPDSALAEYTIAIAEPMRAEQVEERGRLCNDIGIAHHDLGTLDRAREYLDRALALREAIVDSEGLGVTLNNLGRLQQTIGRPDASIPLLERAIAVRRALGDSAGVAAGYANVGYAYDLMAEPTRALEAYSSARRALAGLDHPSYQGLALLNIARAQHALGRHAIARDDVLAGLALKRRAGDVAGVSWAYHDLGRIEVALGHLDVGLSLLDSARQAMRALGDRSREGSALYSMGVALQHAGGDANLRRAVDLYAAAMDARLSVGRTAGRDADRIMFAEQDVSLTAKWASAWLALSPSIGADSAARASLAAAEQGRARALRDLLQESRPVGSESITSRVTSPTLSYLVMPSAVVAWLSLPSGKVTAFCQRVAPRLLDSLVARTRAHIWADREEGRHVIAKVSTMLADSATEAPASCASSGVALSDTTLRTRDGVLAALSRVLLPAALQSQLPDSGELVIVPHAQLALVPFAALPVRRTAEPLGLRYGLRYAPSLSMLAMSDAAAPRSVDGASALIVADPDMPDDPDVGGPFDSLPGARATATWLATTLRSANALTGAGATMSAVRARLPAATLVHLGTHGRAYDTEARARESFVVLAGKDSSALLRVRDVLALPELKAELVVLMACETGLGDLKESEGTSGLQRAFLARGARTVLVSLWRVDRDATDMLVRAFYRNWFAGGQRSKADALRRAQREVFEWRRDRKLDVNPYYWAGFQVVGAR